MLLVRQDGMHDNPCICMVSPLFYPSVGGVEIFSENMAHTLNDAGYRVVLVTSNIAGLPAVEQITDLLTIYRMPTLPLLSGRLPLLVKGRELDQLTERMTDERIDHVVVNTRFYPLSLFGAKFAKSLGIRPVVIDHGSAHITLGNRVIDAFVEAYEHHITRRIISADVDFYGISYRSFQWLRHFGIEPKGVINNAIDAVAFREESSGRGFRHELSLKDDDLLVSFIGRLIPEKGILQLFEAAKALEHEDSIKFAIAGDGPLLQALEADCPSNVFILGRLDRADVSALLAESDAFCAPTRSEGFMTTLLESAAWGTVPIVTDVGGAQEAIPDRSYGTILSTQEPSEVAEAVLALRKNPRRRSSIGRHIRERAEREFTWEKSANALLDACQRANPSRIDQAG